jgi:flagellar hook-basal body complex protein FliE
MTAAILQPQVSQALAVYQSVDNGRSVDNGQSIDDGQASGGAPGSGDFGSLLTRALEGVESTGRQADAQSMQALAGGGDITAVVTAVSRAQLALQTTTAIRDRVLQAYQDIIKMPI